MAWEWTGAGVVAPASFSSPMNDGPSPLPRVPPAIANRIVTRAAIPATENFSAHVVSRSPVPDAVSSEASDAANERMARSRVASRNARENRL